jgi:hypothetical protein
MLKFINKYVPLAVGLIAAMVTSTNLQFAMAQQQQSIQGFGEGSITSSCTPARGPFPADISFQASGSSIGTLTGSFGVFTPEGEQGFFGQITGGRISGNAFMLQGIITEGGLYSCPANITITGNCGSNGQIIFSTVRHEIFLIAKGQVIAAS